MESSKKVMLGLKLPTDPRWVNIVEMNIGEILTDHAYCEQKAASNAISTIIRFNEYTDVVEEMTRISIEEMQHFGMVHQELQKRNLTLGRERQDPYVHDLAGFINKGGSKDEYFVERMLFSAMVEARSCERFRLLSENISDPELREFYRELMASEAEHYTTFLGFARKYCGKVDVEKRWQEFLNFESSLMENMVIKKRCMDNNIRIEHVGPEAIATIQKITRQVWPIAYAEVITPKQIEYMLDMMYSEKSMLQQMNEKGHRFLLLYYNNEAVGFAGYSFQEEKVHRLHKLYLYTHLHGLGLGKKLLDEVCKHSKMAGAEELELNVNRNNKAYFFYQKYGFTLHREEDIDIGGGFFMNDYVLRFRL